jgi:hypothetical protein
MKGAAVSAIAAAVCFSVWTSARAWAAGVSDADPNALSAGFIESLLATIVGAASMPVLLWAGMRALRERGNHPLVLAGAALWLVLGGNAVEGQVGLAATALSLTSFVLLGGLLALVQVPER